MGGTVNSVPRTPAKQTAVFLQQAAQSGSLVLIPGSREARADRPDFWSGVERISRDSHPSFTIGAAVSRDATWHVERRGASDLFWLRRALI
jgi:hypothetical protein